MMFACVVFLLQWQQPWGKLFQVMNCLSWELQWSHVAPVARMLRWLWSFLDSLWSEWVMPSAHRFIYQAALLGNVAFSDCFCMPGLSSALVSTTAGRSLLMADLGVRTEFQHAAQDEGKNNVNTEHLLKWAATACHPYGASQSWQGFMFSNVWWNKLHTKLQKKKYTYRPFPITGKQDIAPSYCQSQGLNLILMCNWQLEKIKCIHQDHREYI